MVLLLRGEVSQSGGKEGRGHNARGREGCTARQERAGQGGGKDESKGAAESYVPLGAMDPTWVFLVLGLAQIQVDPLGLQGGYTRQGDKYAFTPMRPLAAFLAPQDTIVYCTAEQPAGKLRIGPNPEYIQHARYECTAHTGVVNVW